MTTNLHSNNRFAGLAVSRQITATTRSASEMYAIYAARVVADGGFVQDPTACLAAFTAAIANGYWWQVAWARSARWGIRTQGGFITKMYNLWDASLDIYTRGDVDLDTTTMAWATAKFDNTLDFMIVRGVNLNKSNRFGFVSATHRASISLGNTTSYTVGSEAWALGESSGGALSVAGVVKASLSPDFVTPDNGAVGYYVDQDNDDFFVSLDGTLKKINTKVFTHIALNVTADMTTTRAGGATVWEHETWYFNDATAEGVEACCLDVGNRV